MRTNLGFLIFSLLVSASRWAEAGNETRTVPKGIFGFRLNTVYVTGTDYGFGADGKRQTTADMHATSIKDQAVRQISSWSVGNDIFKQITNALQSLPGGQAGLDLAQSAINSIDLGQMKVHVNPTSSVIAPTLLYGLTDNWSLILNLPIIKMKYDVRWEYIPGSSTATLDSTSAAANLLGITSIPSSSQFITMAHQDLAKKGYKPMTSREMSFIGDTLVMNMFSLGKAGGFSFGTMNTVSLPTGPEHDPDDLLDAGPFHHLGVGQEFTTVYTFNRSFRYYASAGIQYFLPEDTLFRVPENEFDLMPDRGRTETVKRQVGMGKFAETGIKYRLLPRFDFSAGVAHFIKDMDRFSGAGSSRYDLLSQFYPAGSATTFKLGLTYDPLSRYRLGSVPIMADINYEEAFSGVNAPATRQLMFSLAIFF